MYSSNGHPGLIVLSASLLLLAGCATSPTANERARSGATAPAPTRDDDAFSTGKLEVVVRDQNGRYVELATVSVWSDELAPTYRSTGRTNYDGRAAFNGVPRQVNVDVRFKNSSYSEAFTLTPHGLSEMQVSIDIGEQEEPRRRGGVGGGVKEP